MGVYQRMSNGSVGKSPNGSGSNGQITSARLKEHQQMYGDNSAHPHNSYYQQQQGRGVAGDRDVSEAAQSTVSVAQSIISKASARKGRF